ncbi:MAG: hypothetical protein L0322_29125, partial [Chloroflexi bacterium]|nr:hypothetical protein [Chloroflexota bacterium]
AADILAGYQFQAFKFRLWYPAWIFPWLLLDDEGQGDSQAATYRLHAGLWFLLTGQLSALIYGQVRVELLNRSLTAAHLVGVPFTFLLPLLAAGLSTIYAARSRERQTERSDC